MRMFIFVFVFVFVFKVVAAHLAQGVKGVQLGYLRVEKDSHRWFF